jgi:hypothetical protein
MALTFDQLRQHGLKAALDAAADSAGASDRVRHLVDQLIVKGVLSNTSHAVDGFINGLPIDIEATLAVLNDDQEAFDILSSAIDTVAALIQSNRGSLTQAAVHRTSNPSTPIRRTWS